MKIKSLLYLLFLCIFLNAVSVYAMKLENISQDKVEKLLLEAKNAREKAYCPYSKFKVGAAVMMEDGSIYTGANVESASYGLTCCAERCAIFKAVNDGKKNILAIAIVLEAPEYGAPCGACRQVIWEFGSKTDPYVIMGTVSGKHKIKRISELLPDAFTLNDE